MAHANALLSNFTGGELSPRLNSRTDTTKFKNGLRTCENFIVTPHGGVRKRSGTRFVIPQKDINDVVYIPFQYNTQQSYMLMFGAGYIWFFRNKGIITDLAPTITGITQASPGVVTATAHGLTSGDYVQIVGVGGMVELNNRLFSVTVINANTFSLVDPSTGAVNTTPYTAFTTGGVANRIVQVTTPYAQADLDELQYAQSADVMYITHRNYALRQLNRLSHTSWTFTQPIIDSGPFRPINTDRFNTITAAPIGWTITGAVSVGGTAPPTPPPYVPPVFNGGETGGGL